MNRYFNILFLFLLFNCGTNEVDCSNAKIDLKFQALYDYNNAFYDDDYTGKVIAWQDDEKTKIESIIYYENGQIIKIENYNSDGDLKAVTPIKCNSRHGTVKYYLNDTITYEVEYFLGRKHGIGKSFYPTGQLHRLVNFKDDEKHGKLTEYSKEGEIIIEEWYSNGEKNAP